MNPVLTGPLYSEIYPDISQDMPEIVSWTWGDPK
jgi:hypothetical protein